MPDQKIAFLNFLQWLIQEKAHHFDILGGDYNLIMSLQDKRGDRRILSKEDKLFKEFIEENNMIDLQSNNGIYTCNNRRVGAAQIACRLDRFLISKHIMLRNDEVHPSILPAARSNH